MGHRGIILGVLLALSMSTIFGAAFAQQGDTWYIGQSAQANTHYIYDIQDFDVKEGSKYTMSLYFKEQDSQGNWVVPVYVVENNGNVLEGTLSLGDNLAIQSSGTTIPKEMNPYIDGYKDTLTWLEAFTSKGSPKSLSAVSWGKIACIGCGTLDPAGSQQVTEAGKTYDATVLVNHRGQTDSKIWVAKELPYPVKALTYADVTTGQPPIQYKFDLVEVGPGQPETPKSQTNVPTPPLTAATGRGTYVVTLNWSPVQIEPGKETTFSVGFTDSRGAQVQRVNYDVTLKDANGKTLQEMKNQFTGESSANSVKATFNQTGPARINVKINSVSGVDTGEFVESSEFSIAVVPEFPVFLVAAITAVVFAVVVAGTRLKGRTFGGLS